MSRISVIRKLKRGGWIPWGILAGTMSLWLLGWYALTHQHHALASVSWKNAPQEGTVYVTVIHADGTPGAHLAVDSKSYSGWSGFRGHTDKEGEASWKPGEREVIALRVGNQVVFERDSLWFSPVNDDGIHFRIKLK